MAKKVLSIEVGYSLIRAMEITMAKKPHITKVFDMEIPEGSVVDGIIQKKDEVAEALKAAIARNRLKTKSVVFTINSSKIASREISIPKVKKSKMDTLIDSNIEDYFPVNRAEYEIAYKVLGDSVDEADKKSAMVYLAPKHILNSYKTLAADCGLKIVAFDYVGNSLFQALKNEKLDGTRMVLKIDENTTLVAVLVGNKQVLQRNISYGVEEIIRNQMNLKHLTYNRTVEYLRNYDALGVGATRGSDTASVQALLGGIQRTLDFFNSRNPETPITKIRLSGMGADFMGIAGQIQTATGIETKILHKLDSFNLDRIFTSTSFGEYIGCFGAAIEPLGLTAGDKKEKSIAEGGINEKTAGMILGGCVLVAVVLVVAGLVPYINAKNANAEKILYLNSLKNSVGAYNDYAVKQAENTYLINLKNATDNMNNNLVAFIEEMEDKLPADVTVGSFSADTSAANMTFTASSKTEAAYIIDMFADFNTVANVSVTGISESINEAGASTVGFSLVCNFKTLEQLAAEEETNE